MRFLIVLCLLASAAAQAFDPTANNTSACLAASNPAGCTAGYTAITTNAANTGAITTIPGPVPANTSLLDLHGLLYSGSNTPIFFHYQDWWGCAGHISIGKVGNNTSAIANEAANMRALGGTGVGMIIDWAGNRDASKACRLTNTNAWATYLTANFATLPLRMAIDVDQAGFQNTCPTGATDQTTCITTELNALLDYVNTNYASQAWYLKDGTNPIVHFFISEASWSGTNWTTVWSSVKTHTNAYTNPFKFVFEDTFTHTQSDGGFSWMANPQVYTSTKQLWWGDGSGTTPTNYNNFYAACGTHPTALCFGAAKKGFDDGIGFGGGFTGVNRVQSQRCGRTWLDTFNLIGIDGFSSSNQLKYLQIPTWNDYEEGSAMEMGIDNCVTVAASITATTLNYTLTPTDATYFTLNTIHHLQVLYCTVSTSCIVVPGQGNITPALSGSAPLAAVPLGNWTIQLQAVGQPAIRNKLSNAVAFSNVPTSKVPKLFVKVLQQTNPTLKGDL